MEKNIAEKIKSIRTALNLTTRDFAKPLKTSNSHISQLENGKVKISESLIELIILAYGISRKWWETGEGPMFAKPRISALGEKWVTMYEQLSEEDRKKIEADIENRFEISQMRKKLEKFESEVKKNVS